MARNKKLYLQTTTVAAEKSMAEISAVLMRSGARTISTAFENGKPSGLEWSMVIYDQPVYFRMPAKVDAVYQTLRKQRRGPVSDVERLRDQAERVAWRQLLAWVQVQLTMIEIGMVEHAQVFLPYACDQPGGITMWDAFREQRFKAIEAPKL